MLDPHRIGLNAESIGFQKRMLQDLDYEAMHKAMQTDYNNQNSAVQVRREQEAAKNEIRVMGGQLSGFESNELLLTYARQQRQINGYPLRHFDANNPAVVLPKKYGGFPLYNRNQTEYPELVSVFTEPMSAPLQRDTELLGRAGAVAMTNDLNEPYAPPTFLNPMSASIETLDQNKNVFKQRKHLQRMADTSRKQKYESTSGVGVFVNKDGTPMSTADDAVTDAVAQNNTFKTAETRFGIRATQLMYREPLVGGAAAGLQMDGNTEAIGLLRHDHFNPEERTVTMRSNESLFRDVEDDNVSYLRSANEFPQVVPLTLSMVQSLPNSGRGLSQQAQSIYGGSTISSLTNPSFQSVSEVSFGDSTFGRLTADQGSLKDLRVYPGSASVSTFAESVGQLGSVSTYPQSAASTVNRGIRAPVAIKSGGSRVSHTSTLSRYNKKGIRRKISGGARRQWITYGVSERAYKYRKERGLPDPADKFGI